MHLKLLTLSLLTASSIYANTVSQNCAGTELKVTLDDQTIKVGESSSPHYKIEGKLYYTINASNTMWVEQWIDNDASNYYQKDHQTANEPYTKMNLQGNLHPYQITIPGSYHTKLHVKIVARNCDLTAESITTVI